MFCTVRIFLYTVCHPIIFSSPPCPLIHSPIIPTYIILPSSHPSPHPPIHPPILLCSHSLVLLSFSHPPIIIPSSHPHIHHPVLPSFSHPSSHAPIILSSHHPPTISSSSHYPIILPSFCAPVVLPPSRLPIIIPFSSHPPNLSSFPVWNEDQEKLAAPSTGVIFSQARSRAAADWALRRQRRELFVNPGMRWKNLEGAEVNCEMEENKITDCGRSLPAQGHRRSPM